MKQSDLVVFSMIVLCGLLFTPTVFVKADSEGYQTTSPDVPDDWGLETETIETIPEPLTIVAVILLSSVAIAISFYFLRKRPQTESPSAVKTQGSTTSNA